MKTYVGMVIGKGELLPTGTVMVSTEVQVEVHEDGGPVFLSTRDDAWATWSAPDPLALTAVDDVTISTIWDDLAAERKRAHRKHGEKSMEHRPPAAESRLRILTEELGEIAREFNDAEIESRPLDLDHLREELVQLGAMAAAWADVLPRPVQPRTPSRVPGLPS